MMAKILYINPVVGEEEEEAKDDETRPTSVPLPKKNAPWQTVIQTQR
jgi:hypothetical protein